MAGSKKTITLSPLEKWRRLKDKVLEAASVDPKSATRKQSSSGPDGGPSFIPAESSINGDRTHVGCPKADR